MVLDFGLALAKGPRVSMADFYAERRTTHDLDPIIGSREPAGKRGHRARSGGRQAVLGKEVREGGRPYLWAGDGRLDHISLDISTEIWIVV